MEMMEHIACHSIQVCRVAMTLADHLDDDHHHINRELVRASSLLHDITKTRSFRTRENHAETGGQLLSEMGFSSVGNIIRQHVKLDRYFASGRPDEAEIVNYADKRVLHDKVVSIDTRMAYILERYGETPELVERLTWLKEKTLLQEERIFEKLPFAPDALDEQLGQDQYFASFETYCRQTNQQLPCQPVSGSTN